MDGRIDLTCIVPLLCKPFAVVRSFNTCHAARHSHIGPCRAWPGRFSRHRQTNKHDCKPVLAAASSYSCNATQPLCAVAYRVLPLRPSMAVRRMVCLSTGEALTKSRPRLRKPATGPLCRQAWAWA